ncbi:ABC transporter substrate-binding protein [Plantactinospora sp. KBS50]|uniref:ABC transporter substrate-binding protein n=1 Tax=Plantactinospora sp. KBS50 TaxID=2024580 RepID=UPI000BAB0E6E|nr:ABC transporter substrate-binding protein [Plantactinospora sp. KBS50]ASW53199.1 ABC transporter substrate-binding protein [Plantactinospora sp. KBS50]
MLRRTPALVAVLAAATLAVTGCGGGNDTPAAPASASDAAYPVSVGTVTLTEQPTKIVSLSPTATEMLFAIGAGSQVAAVDDQSNYPPEAPKTDLSGYQPNAEAIAGSSPDLVVLANDTNKIVDQLTKLKVPVYVAPAAKTLDDTYQQISDLGRLTGHADQATALNGQMKNDIDKLITDLPRPAGKKLRYYYELDPNYYTVTDQTFVGALFGELGLTSIANSADKDGSAGGYPQLSPEVVIDAGPDFVFLADVNCCQQTPEKVSERAGWGGIPAVTQHRVVALDDDIASRWGPRTVDLVRTVADAVAAASN